MHRPPLRPDITRAFAHVTAMLDFSKLTTMAEMIAAARGIVERYGDVEPRASLDDVVLKPVQIGDMAAEWVYSRHAHGDCRILYLHGGGLLAGSLNSHRGIVAELARQSRYPVLHIAYRLAPEHVFPAAHDDCAAAYDWIRANAPDGARSARHVFVAGDSAGGNLAAALCARAIESGGVVPDALALLGGTLDNADYPDRPDRPGDPVVNRQSIAGILAYASESMRNDPRISSLNTPDALLAYFPATLIQVSAAEYVLEHGQTLAARLTALGRRNLLSVWPALPHVWHYFQTLLPEAKSAIAEVAAFFQAGDTTTKR